MAEYQFMKNAGFVLRVADMANIPNDVLNSDWKQYQKWLADGGVTDPYVPPAVGMAKLAPEVSVLFNHENRLRMLEGEPAIGLQEFLDKNMTMAALEAEEEE